VGTTNALATSVWRFIVYAVSLAGMPALGGCNVSGSYCEQPHLVLSSSDTQPGTVRAAAVFRTYATGVAALSDGSVVCLTCTGPVVLDVGLHQTRGIDQISPYVAVGPDDTIYALWHTSLGR
jgi:hypothetical protein